MNDFDPNLLRPELVRAARALLGWSRKELAHHAMMAPATIARVEGVRTDGGKPQQQIMRRLCYLFQDRGIEFVVDQRGVIGVSLREQRP